MDHADFCGTNFGCANNCEACKAAWFFARKKAEVLKSTYNKRKPKSALCTGGKRKQTSAMR